VKATIRPLSNNDYPWGYALRLLSMDDTFREFLDEFKESIPHRSRRWVADLREWWLKPDVIDAVEQILISRGIAYTIEGADDRPLAFNRSQAAACLYLLPSAPPEVVTAAYRALAKQYHPDRGGSTEQMQRLNAALEVLR